MTATFLFEGEVKFHAECTEGAES